MGDEGSGGRHGGQKTSMWSPHGVSSVALVCFGLDRGDVWLGDVQGKQRTVKNKARGDDGDGCLLEGLCLVIQVSLREGLAASNTVRQGERHTVCWRNNDARDGVWEAAQDWDTLVLRSGAGALTERNYDGKWAMGGYVPEASRGGG